MVSPELRAVTFDLWYTILSWSKEAESWLRETRLARLERILEGAGLPGLGDRLRQFWDVDRRRVMEETRRGGESTSPASTTPRSSWTWSALRRT